MSASGTNGSPLTDGASDPSNRNVKCDRPRRCWSPCEDAILMTTLKELVATGWKSDNGFRSRYLTRCLEALKREFPKTDIRAHPHIYSKITTWKRNYYSLMTILDRSGVGFNPHGDYKIDIDDEQWSQVVQKDVNAKYMRNKSWPMLDDWKEVFGKDRAEGVRSVDLEDAVNKIYGAKAVANEVSGTNDHMTFEELFPDEVLPDGILPEMIGESPSPPERATNKVPHKVIKKRKVEDQMDGVLNLMSRIHEDTNERLKEISSRIGYDFDLSTKRTEIFKQLKGIPGLTMKQQFYVSKKLVKEPELMDLFRGLDEVARPAFVLDILEDDGLI
ncbi:uncharacterized protein LOC121749738 isoform X1 [Salvia splendens]|uniref:uncharacterized protein LOC121749738 isoform X1 n=1 Tax=Salvia splendens TaxID=180675 RepID=UPI00110280C0|nr:uncharacterized protein LOC121749738 isoform X1 [Salvia splendens]XP_042000291.1 uncharacterized protein LOC121749738 isoform X1 [Salvia splendens]